MLKFILTSLWVLAELPLNQLSSAIFDAPTSDQDFFSIAKTDTLPVARLYVSPSLRHDLGDTFLIQELAAKSGLSGTLFIFRPSDFKENLISDRKKLRLKPKDSFGDFQLKNEEFKLKALKAFFLKNNIAFIPDEMLKSLYLCILRNGPYSVHDDENGSAIILLPDFKLEVPLDNGKGIAHLLTGLPESAFRPFSLPSQSFLPFYAVHENGHIRKQDGALHNLVQPIWMEAGHDSVALYETFKAMIIPEKIAQFAVQWNGLHEMAGLFALRTYNYNFIYANSHASYMMYDVAPNGSIKPSENDAERVAVLALHVNSLVHLLLAFYKGGQDLNFKDMNFKPELGAGSRIALSDPDLYYAAVKLLFDKGYFKPGTEVYKACQRFLIACEKHLQNSYIDSKKVKNFINHFSNMASLKDEWMGWHENIPPYTVVSSPWNSSGYLNSLLPELTR